MGLALNLTTSTVLLVGNPWKQWKSFTILYMLLFYNLELLGIKSVSWDRDEIHNLDNEWTMYNNIFPKEYFDFY